MKRLSLIYFTFFSAVVFSQTENQSVRTIYEGKLPDQLIHFQIPPSDDGELLCIDSLYINHKCIPLSLVTSSNFDFDLQYCGIPISEIIKIKLYHPQSCTPVVSANWKRKPKITTTVLIEKVEAPVLPKENPASACMTVEGAVPENNLYFQVPETYDGDKLCIDSVFINERQIPDSVFNQNAFELSFAQYGFKPGDQVIIKIYHPQDCKPKLLNNYCHLPSKNHVQFLEIKVE